MQPKTRAILTNRINGGTSEQFFTAIDEGGKLHLVLKLL